MKKQLVEKFFNISIDHPCNQIQAETDSKKIQPGMIFFAIEGKKTDGHLFVEEAKKNGAILAVVDKNKIPDVDIPYVSVSNTVETLQSLAKFHVQSMFCKIIGITGSVGKSTTKEFISQILETSYKVGKTQGNRNSQIGLALSLIDLLGDEEVLVLEMGMSQPGDIKKLMKMVVPHISVLTNIGISHIGNFNSILGIADEKSDIVDHPLIELALIEKNCFQYEVLRKKLKTQYVSYNLDQFVKGDTFHYEDFSFDLNQLEMRQDHFIKNLIPAIGIAKYLNVPNDKIEARIFSLEGLDHRFKVIKDKKCLIIDDAYNSSLESLSLAIESIQKQKIHGKKIAVIGAILEQGHFSYEHHVEVGKVLNGKFERIYCIGDPMLVAFDYLKEKGQEVYFLNTKKEIVDAINRDLDSEDLIFLKGSNSYRLWEIVDLI